MNDPAIDVVVELIGGLDPAGSLIRDALEAGKPVVTANKELLAAPEGVALRRLAKEQAVDLLYEAAVAGAIPLVRALRESLTGERIRRVMGIVNGTTNFILTDDGRRGRSTTPHALAEAQALGFAERDPTADVEGYDAAAKAAILAGVAFGYDVADADVMPRGHHRYRGRRHRLRRPAGLRGEAAGRRRAEWRRRAVGARPSRHGAARRIRWPASGVRSTPSSSRARRRAS